MPDRDQMTARIDSFLSNRDAGTLTGERRMSPEKLLDMLAGRIMMDDTANIIRIRSKDDLSELLISGRRVTDRDHVLIYIDLSMDETAHIMTAFPDAHIYRAKELCHQVPVCYREFIVRCHPSCRK
jgi:hypothetical protein